MIDDYDYLPTTRPHEPEARLWQSVILRAIADEDWPWFAPDAPQDTALDYLLVCDLAGVDPEALRARVFESVLRRACRK